MLKTPILACFLATTLVVGAGFATPVTAEVIHLRNGTQVSGKIVKDDAVSFAIETSDGTRRKIPKKDVETHAPPDPIVALLTGLIFAGGGHFYAGVYDRGALFLGLSAAGGALGYLAARQIRPTSPSTAAVTAIIVYLFPALLGGLDAMAASSDISAHPRYRIDYDGR